MENITFRTNEQLWKIENAAASAGYRKTNDCYWAQIFRNEETGHEFSTSREENSTNDPAADLVAMLTPAEEVPAAAHNDGGESKDNAGKMRIEKIREALESRKARNAWDRGVKVYASELLDELAEAIEGGYFDAADIATPELLKKQLLNGAESWDQYSWGGCSLCYDGQIAERLCTPSELKKTRGGDRRPNSREEWMDVQARALYRAANIICRLAREATAEC